MGLRGPGVAPEAADKPTFGRHAGPKGSYLSFPRRFLAFPGVAVVMLRDSNRPGDAVLSIRDLFWRVSAYVQDYLGKDFSSSNEAPQAKNTKYLF